jgi:23S rRNA pseudouridine1911/1915/1917 synthase
MTDWILHNDNAVIVLNKPSSIPTQPDQTGDASLLQLTEEFLHEKLYLVHRLDRVASGLVVFAKTPEAAAALSVQFQLKKTEKRYWAIVENKPPKDTDILTHFLKKNAKTNTSKAYDIETKDAKRAELRYILRGVSDRYVLLEIELFTGRHHQIRAQLSKMGCSIKGDVKYGARRSNVNRSIHLHAWKLQFEHPVSKEIIVFQCEPDKSDKLWSIFSLNSSQINKF